MVYLLRTENERRKVFVDYITINIEVGMPTVERARIRLEQELRSAKSRRVSAVKIIHGYGSTGKGGAIKRDVQVCLDEKKRAGQIKAFVPGERFSPFDADARQIVTACSPLTKDRDYTKSNHGITVVLL